MLVHAPEVLVHGQPDQPCECDQQKWAVDEDLKNLWQRAEPARQQVSITLFHKLNSVTRGSSASLMIYCNLSRHRTGRELKTGDWESKLS